MPTGTRRVMSGAAAPYWSEPRPFSPFLARCRRA
ncbi:Uncharacterised protein [Bordetella pertussis]|nr:Uncharacterised protein [Bordetella pertussis]